MTNIFFDEVAPSGSTSFNPWIEDYIEMTPPPYEVDSVMAIKRTKKRTGYVVETKAYSLMLYEGSQILEHLLVALNTWIETGEGYRIICQPISEYPHYRLGVNQDAPMRWILTKGKYTPFTMAGSTSVPVATSNPFLPPHPSVVPPTRHKSPKTPTI